eukprot:3032641-Pleurochrysis_carterae.AAC.1
MEGRRALGGEEERARGEPDCRSSEWARGVFNHKSCKLGPRLFASTAVVQRLGQVIRDASKHRQQAHTAPFAP